MISRTMHKLGENKFLIMALLWALCWAFPWVNLLKTLPWVRVGISIVIFATPGIIVSLLLAGKRLTLLTHFVSGVAISVFFIGALGLFGRIVHLPFDFIKPVFALIGLICFLILYKHSQSESQLYKPKRFSLITAILLSLMIIFSILITFESRIFSDDFSYMVYLTNWQNAQPLNFHELIFNTGGLDSIRFWLAMFPMDLAFLAQTSNTHGVLLIGLYIEPFFVTIAMFATYNLYEDLFESEYVVMGAMLLQFAFLLLRYGMYIGIVFFNHLSQDKAFAAVILAPVFFIAIRYFLESFNWRSMLFVLLTGLSLTLTHPVTLAFSIFIAGVYAGVVTLTNKDYKKLGVTVAFLILIIALPACLRIVEIPAVSRYIPMLNTIDKKGVFDLESALNTKAIDQRISYIKKTPFYGFNLSSIKLHTSLIANENWFQDFSSWSYMWILELGFLWSLFNLKKNRMAPFIAATSLLVLLSAIPYTGWLVGYFVSARLLFRAAWMLPVGLIGATLMVELFKFIFPKIPRLTQAKILAEWVTFGLLLIISVGSIAFIYGSSVYQPKWNLLTNVPAYEYHLKTMAELGNSLEKQIPSPAVFVAPNGGLMNYLPGLSSKSKVVFFRLPELSIYAIKPQEIDLIYSHNAEISLQQRIDILKKYHIQYILMYNNVDTKYFANNSQFGGAQKAGNYWIVEYLGGNQ